MSKGGGKGHTPYEAPDSLKSVQQLSIIDAIYLVQFIFKLFNFIFNTF
ncbi:hypothetical protein CJD89_004381 [Salmonella enterica subsp. enterica serovar Saintpaul]|nr:hypothetical protein [Salmonella enterica subsp. enterica serovar Saintpaul]EDR0879156.1 hypothetical protein [Salmonella enterica]EDR4560021.1 hypothetical protein [Salmonella enterica subsp. enterica serovar Miami]EDQ6994674.1 hypothetical protein [Salmonella enterica subsp. enterica serovar Saintpaul]EDS8697548.1 hypothetical protein [Salmonella enterica]